MEKVISSDKIPELFSVEGKVCFITGIGGLGSTLARAFAHNGAKLALANRTKAKADAVCEELAGEGAEARSYAMDVSDREDVQRVVRQVKEDFGSVDICIHTAAVGYNDDPLNLNVEELKITTEINYYGALYVNEACGNVMAEQGWGRIININSIDGYSVNCIDGMTYANTKAAMQQLTRAYGVTLAKKGVTVNGIAPVWIWTPMMEQRPKDYMVQAAATIPMGRVSYAEDYIGMTFFLASEASAYITGQTFLVDGGWRATRVFHYVDEEGNIH